MLDGQVFRDGHLRRIVDRFFVFVSAFLVFLFLGVKLASAQVVINEIMYDPEKVSDARGEWFELYNPTDEDVDLLNWKINDSGTNSYVILDSLSIPAGGFLVMCRDGDKADNGGVTCDHVYSSFQLANEEDEIIITDSNNNEVDRVEYEAGGGFPSKKGTSIELSNHLLDNNLDDSWHLSTELYGLGDYGSPGVQNSFPPSPTPIPTPTLTSTPTPTPTPGSTQTPTPEPTKTFVPTKKPKAVVTLTTEDGVSDDKDGVEVLGEKDEVISPPELKEETSDNFPKAALLLIGGGFLFIGAAAYPLIKENLKSFSLNKKELVDLDNRQYENKNKNS